jgi:hypothetical protein
MTMIINQLSPSLTLGVGVMAMTNGEIGDEIKEIKELWVWVRGMATREER